MMAGNIDISKSFQEPPPLFAIPRTILHTWENHLVVVLWGGGRSFPLPPSSSFSRFIVIIIICFFPFCNLGAWFAVFSPSPPCTCPTDPFSGILCPTSVPSPPRVSAICLVFGSQLLPTPDLHSWVFVFGYGDLQKWLQMVLWCPSDTKLVSFAGDSHPTSINAFSRWCGSPSDVLW